MNNDKMNDEIIAFIEDLEGIDERGNIEDRLAIAQRVADLETDLYKTRMRETERHKMSDFDSWFETYERDGGELMLYNTVDLEIAYGAGQRAGFREASDKAAKLPQRVMFDAGHEAGRKAGLEEAAEIAVATGSLGNTDAGFDMADQIAAAIRERMK